MSLPSDQPGAAASGVRLRKLGDWLVEHPKSVGVSLLFATLLLGAAAARIETNETPYILKTDHPARAWEAELAETFTDSGEQSLVVLISPDGVFTADLLEKLSVLTEGLEGMMLIDASDADRLRELAREGADRDAVEEILSDGLTSWDAAAVSELREGLAAKGLLTQERDRYLRDLEVRVAPVREVTSLWNTDDIRAAGDDLSVAPLLRKMPSSASQREALRHDALENPLFRGALVSEDGTATAIHVEFAIEKDDARNMKRAHAAILAEIDAAGASEVAHLAGAPEVLFQTGNVMARDNDRFFPIVVLVIGLVLFAGMRSLSGVIVPLAIAVLTVVWTLGLMQVSGTRLTTLTTALPVILITISVADAIHFLSHYSGLEPAIGRERAIRETLRELARPIVLTSVTTAIGFVAIGFTPLVNIREFGVFAAIGVMFALVLTLGLLPALIRMIPSRRAAPLEGRRDRLATGVARGLLVHRGSVLAASAAVFGLAAWEATDLRADATNLDAFDELSRVRVDNTKINQHLGGTFPLDLWVVSEREGAIAEPEVMRALEAIEAELLDHPAIGYAIGPTDYVARVHDVLTDGEDSRLPSELPRELIAQYLLLAEGGDRLDLRDVLDGTRSHARIMALGRTDRGSTWEDVIDRVESVARRVLPAGVELRFSGYGMIMKSVVSEVVRTQARSLLISAGVIALVMMLLFRSVTIGCIAVFPLIGTLSLNFGTMSGLGIHLDVGTVIIASVVFGIGIDYSIHFIEGVRRQRPRGASSLRAAIEAAWRSVAPPIALNSLSVGAGFLVLTSSGFAPLRELGALVAGTLLLSALAGLSTLPALLSFWGGRLIGSRSGEPDAGDTNLPVRPPLEAAAGGATPSMRRSRDR